MSIIFHFVKEKVIDGYVQRPVIPIILKHNDNSIATEAIVDSGSDCTFLPYDVAEDLGLALSKKKSETLGLEGKTYCYESKCQVQLQDRKFREKYSFNIPVSVGLAKYAEEQRIILGRNPIFNAFEITFNQPKNQIVFKRLIKPVHSIKGLKRVR
ncbi:MAG: aspartyl protease family protein [Candidatus Diapherotrites archaeon]|nr:hypothetical protein [Candidatus Micrarchaeota archaeon]MBU1939516.1 hypothetical protein [Candidatus Micrarchaeota archaeon]